MIIPQSSTSAVNTSMVVSRAPSRTRRCHRSARKVAADSTTSANRNMKKPEKMRAWHNSVWKYMYSFLY